MDRIGSKNSVPVVTAADKAEPVVATWDATTKDEKGGVALYIGQGGNVEVKLVNKPLNYVIFYNVPTGSFMPLNCIGLGPNTTATQILKLF